MPYSVGSIPQGNYAHGPWIRLNCAYPPRNAQKKIPQGMLLQA
jgi:hypothetical protein